MVYNTVIFDMDGVLFDTEHFYFERRKTFLEQEDISISHLTPAYFIGGNMKQVWETILGDAYDDYDVPKLQKDYVSYKEANPIPYHNLVFPRVQDLLDGLKKRGYRLGLASSSVKADITRALDSIGIRHYFDVILSGEDFVESKPDPAIYKEAFKQMEVNPDQVLIIEDSEKGIRAGARAGAEVWAIKDNRFGLDQCRASRTLDHLGQVLPLLDSMQNFA